LAILGALLNFIGAFVASTIWPIVYGLFNSKLIGRWAGIAMLLGTSVGLVSYFLIGFYVAAISSCLVSFIICQWAMRTNRTAFDWTDLQETKS
jgi:hypothetical protein